MEGGLNPTYVLDEMEQYEIRPLIQNLHKKSKESWEQARLVAYITAQTQSTKKLKLTDIIQFPWEDDNIKVSHEVSEEDKERLRQQAEIFKNRIYGKQ